MKTVRVFAVYSLLVLGCWPAQPCWAGGPVQPRIPLGLDGYLPVPESNPLELDKVLLGRKLFHDRRLSRNQQLSCADCHRPDYRFTNDLPVSIGVFGRKGRRRVPALLNRGYGKSFFWDGRVQTLEEQVLKPIVAHDEMDLPLEAAVERLKPEVRSVEELAQALASYVRTIFSGNSPYDRYVAGDSVALTEKQLRGLEIFLGKGNCAVCHLGPNLTDEQFHNTGIGWADGKFQDPGRFEVTGRRADMGAFKTPTLRDVALRPPYMHDGSLKTLEEVVEHYDRGGNPNPWLDPEIVPLHLSPEEKEALVEFLKALTGELREGTDSLAVETTRNQ